MIERQGACLVIKVPLTMDNANAVLEAGIAALQPGEQIFDFSQIGEADSSAVAVMLGWVRAAAQSRSTVKFANIPAGVRSLAELYGVSVFLPLA